MKKFIYTPVLLILPCFLFLSTSAFTQQMGSKLSGIQSMKASADAQRLGEQANLQKQVEIQHEMKLGFMLHLPKNTATKKIPSTRSVVNGPDEYMLMATIYVKHDASGGNDGTSWGDAYTDLQDALAAATLGDQIWVAAGTYLPGADEFSTFNLTQDVEIYGGFAGTESSIAERDIDSNPTILSGDVANDDVADDFTTNRDDNVQHVMSIENTVTTAMIIDGLIFQGGHADGIDSLNQNGAGVMSLGGAQFENCEFRQNFAVFVGGGVAFSDADCHVNNCTFIGNRANGAGGGLFFTSVESTHLIEIAGTTFENNVATAAGAVYCDSHSSNNQMTITNSEFQDNKSIALDTAIVNIGGAIVYASWDGTSNNSTLIDNCIFNNNTSEGTGGAIYHFVESLSTNCSATIDNSNFDNNTTEGSGGAIFNFITGGDSDLELTNSTFTDNSSIEWGGAVRDLTFGNNVTSNISNCTFENNEATLGGGVASQMSGDENQSTITGCDFLNNSVSLLSERPVIGGAVFYFIEGVSNNSSVDSSHFENNTSEESGGAIYNTVVGENTDLELTNSTFTNNSSMELGGAVRTLMGANNGTSTISDCTFENNEATDGGAVALLMQGEINQSTFTGCDFGNNSAASEGGGLYVFDEGIDNALDLQNTSFLSNNALYGGGIQNSAEGTNHEVSISNCNFQNNQADNFGGGYRAQSEDLNFRVTIEDCLFEKNNADIDGGGFEIAQLDQADCELEIKRTDFIENTSGNEGAGLNFYSQDDATANIFFENLRFKDNHNDASGNAVEGAGGFSLNNFGTGVVNIDFRSVIFENNDSEDGAGAIQLYKPATASNDMVNMENCLLIGNSSGGGLASGISLLGSVELTVKSTTIADNDNMGITVGSGVLNLQNTILHNPGTANFMTITPGNVTSLGGNLVGDETMADLLTPMDKSNLVPIFMNSGNNPYELADGSLGIDAGIDAGVTSEFDIIGNDRIQGARVDIGAYESPFVSSSKETIVDNSALSIFPNPVIDILNIELENDWQGELVLRIINTLGQEVFFQNIDKYQNADKWQIDLSDMIPGMYQVSISDGEKMMVRPLAKQ